MLAEKKNGMRMKSEMTFCNFTVTISTENLSLRVHSVRTR